MPTGVSEQSARAQPLSQEHQPCTQVPWPEHSFVPIEKQRWSNSKAQRSEWVDQNVNASKCGTLAVLWSPCWFRLSCARLAPKFDLYVYSCTGSGRAYVCACVHARVHVDLRAVPCNRSSLAPNYQGCRSSGTPIPQVGHTAREDSDQLRPSTAHRPFDNRSGCCMCICTRMRAFVRVSIQVCIRVWSGAHVAMQE